MFHHQDQDHDQPNLLPFDVRKFNEYITKLPRYRINIISDLKQTVSKHKAERIQSVFKKTKKKIKTSYNGGRWTKQEEDLYLKFIHQAKSSQSWGQKETYKKRKNYFTEMSKFIKTRSPLQCRSHDQKMVLKNSTSDPISSSEDSSEISQESGSESESSVSEETPSEAKIEVKAESESHHTRETQHEISPQSNHTPRFNFDLPGLTKPDPYFNLICRENLQGLKPIFPSPSLARNLQSLHKENELEKKSMPVEEEGAQGKDLEKVREEYFVMMRRMMRRRMLDVLSSCPMLEE